MSNASRRLVDALDAVGARPGGLTVTDLARELDVSKATGSRLLASLVEAGLVAKVDAQRHVLDLRLWTWGVQATRGVRRIADIARPMVIEAVKQSGAPIAVSVVHGDRTIFLEVAAPSHDSVIVLPCPTIIPVYACAPGKTILAYAAPGRIDALLERPLERFTDQTVTSPELLREELRQVREQGYALNHTEFFPETIGVAVPVFDARSEAVAAVGSSGPTSTLEIADLERMVPMLSNLSDSVSAALGYLPAAYMVG